MKEIVKEYKIMTKNRIGIAFFIIVSYVISSWRFTTFRASNLTKGGFEI